jgi:transposase
MTKQRRSFSAEFKREAVALVLDQGYSHIEACRSLGVVEFALRRWVNQVQQERNGVTPQTKALTPEQQKIQELEARIARLGRVKSILKKANALLMSEEHERKR